MTDVGFFESDEDGDLAALTVQVVTALLARAGKIESVTSLSAANAVGYAFRALTEEQASEVERCALSDGGRSTLVSAVQATSRFQRMTPGQISQVAAVGGPDQEFASEYLALVGRAVPASQEGVAGLLARGLDGLRAAHAAIAAALRSASTAPQMAAAFRSSGAGVVAEGEISVSRIWSEEALTLAVDGSPNQEVFVSLESGSGPLRLGHAPVSDGTVTLPIDSALVVDGTLRVRLGAWPGTGGAAPLLCVHQGRFVAPFAELETAPAVSGGQLHLSIRWLPDEVVAVPGVLSVSVGTSPDQWQVLGSYPVVDLDGDTEFSFGCPMPDGHLSWPLRLDWDSAA